MLASPGARLVVLATSPRVAPGLLTARAWDTLREARRVLAGPQGQPQLAALAEAGIKGQPVAADDAAAQAAALVRELAAGPGTVVWLAGPAGDEATGSLLAALPGDVAAELLTGAADLPGARLLDLVATMDTLRVNCPWDASRTHESLAPHLLEESYEALEALEEGDQAAFRDELGDVLLQVVFHARVAAERTDGTAYSIDDVADRIVAKLVRRHPHVFAGVEVSGAEEVKSNWDAIKASERASPGGLPASALDGVPFGQPALALAVQLQRRAERSGVPAALASEDEPADPPAALGAELLRLVSRARAADLDPELELRAAARRYRDRVQAWEHAQRQPG